MNQETFSQIINAGQPVEITPALMSAVHECAHRERSEALKSGARWLRCKLKNTVLFREQRDSGSLNIQQQSSHASG